MSRGSTWGKTTPRAPRKAKPEPEITGSMDGMAPYNHDDGFNDLPNPRRAGLGRLGGDNRPHYRGPMPGQTVMGVDRLHDGNPGSFLGDEGHYQVDPHGFVLEHYGTHGHDQRGSLPGVAKSQPARSLYESHGGMYGKNSRDSYAEIGLSLPSAVSQGVATPEDIAQHDRMYRAVTQHWRNQPLVQMPTNALIHTGQDYENTEGDDTGEGREGRLRIEGIREDVERGAKVRKPAWIAKVNGRHFALDGHHRIVGAREAGAETFPARVWDIDSENAARTRSVDKLPENVRLQMRRSVDAGVLHPDAIHPKWRSDVMRDAKPPHVLNNKYQVD